MASIAYTKAIQSDVASYHDELEGLTSIKASLAKHLAQSHKVTLHEFDLVRETSGSGILARPANLEVVVVHADDLDASEACNLARGTSNTTADIENAHARLEAHLESEIVLVACQLWKPKKSIFVEETKSCH